MQAGDEIVSLQDCTKWQPLNLEGYAIGAPWWPGLRPVRRKVGGSAAAQPAQQWQHLGGGIYTEVGRGKFKVSDAPGWRDAVFYRSDADGALYGRTVASFENRFERVGAAPGTGTGEAA